MSAAISTKNTPANVAAIAGQGKRNGKGSNPTERTSPVVAVDAPTRTDDGIVAAVTARADGTTVESALDLITSPASVEAFDVETFRAAIVAADSAKGDSATATATLLAATLARYAKHAARFTHEVDGKPVVLSNDRAAVALKVWNDAGFGKAPASKERTPALKSLGQYVASMGTVATDLAYGTEHFVNVESYSAAIGEIREFGAEAKQRADDAAFEQWKNTLNDDDSAALNRVISLMLLDTSDDYRAAFKRAVTPAK